MIIPNPTEAPVGTNIVVTVSDDVAVDRASIALTLSGSKSGNVSGSTTIVPSTAGQVSYAVTFDPSQNLDFEEVVTVTVACSDLAGNATGVKTFTFQTAPFSGNPYPADDGDPDDDGIPNKYELAYGTDPGKKTLFVRPKKKVGGAWGFWGEFCDVYRPLLTAYTGTGQGQLGIEIVCVGPWLKSDGTTHHLQYDKLWNLDYNPKTDTTGPVDPGTGQNLIGVQPIDIVDIYFNDPADPSGIKSGTVNKGHTFFHSTNKLWYWDIPAHATSTLSYLDNGYLTAYLYPFTIDQYFSEGQYDSIALNATKQITGNSCYGTACDKPASPFNYDKYSETPPSSVELNLIVFDASGAVTADPVLSTTQWNKQQVILRTLAHELGHALSASNIPEDDHCDDKMCILYPFTAQENQWTLTSFHCPVHTVEFMRGKVHNKPGAN